MKRILVLALTLVAAAPLRAQSGVPPFKVERTGGGRPMILIPGLLSSGEVWRGTVDRLRGRYDMHVLTLAGFAGAPPSGADPFLATTRDAIIRYIRDNRLEKPVIVGHSLGGFMALWIASTVPDLVGPVVAVDGVPYLGALGDTTMTPARAAPYAIGMKANFAGLSAEALGAQTRMAMTSQVKDTAWHTIGARWGAASDGATAGRAIAEMLTTDIRPEVARITAPVLMFMAGNGMTAEQQAMILGRYRGQLAGVRDARVVAVPNARHFIMIDDPEFFHSTLTAFLGTP